MQKRYLLMITLALISLLLTGCLGGTSTKYVYDGSPTALEVVIKRDGASVATMSAEPEQYVQVRLWMDNDSGETIYQATERVPLSEITGEGYTLSRQVPADRGYSVLAIYSDNQGYFEVAQQFKINAPAERATTANVNMVPVEYEIVIPEVMYSGGTMNQFKIIFPEEYEYLFNYGIYYVNLPWEVNGGNYLINYSTPKQPKNARTVSEPMELFYQFAISVDYRIINVDRTYIPNLEYETDLPTFWIYPHPGWGE